MILGSKKTQNEMMAFVPSMKANMSEWQIITIKLPVAGKEEQDQILQNVLKTYEDKEGIIFPVDNYKILLVIRLGIINNYAILKSEIEMKMPKHDARVIARKMSATGLKQIQLDLSERGVNKISMYSERAERKENVFLIADDDVFVRKTIAKSLEPYGQVVMAENGTEVIGKYMSCNPDVILLDIHMPGVSGLELVEQIMEVDTDSFILMVSADSVRDNIIDAMANGAVGFLAKPVIKSKLLNYINQCITFQIN